MAISMWLAKKLHHLQKTELLAKNLIINGANYVLLPPPPTVIARSGSDVAISMWLAKKLHRLQKVIWLAKKL